MILDSQTINEQHTVLITVVSGRICHAQSICLFLNDILVSVFRVIRIHHQNFRHIFNVGDVLCPCKRFTILIIDQKVSAQENRNAVQPVIHSKPFQRKGENIFRSQHVIRRDWLDPSGIYDLVPHYGIKHDHIDA